MPIATPEVYAEMIDRAKAGGFAYPAVNVTSSQTLNAALQGFAEAESDGIIQVSTGGADYCVRRHRQGPGRRLARASPRSPTRSPRTTPSPSRCTPTTARRTSSTASCCRCSPLRGSRSRPAATRSSSRTCGTARPCRSTRTCASPRSCSSCTAAANDDPRGRDRRRRRRGGRRRERHQRQALHHRRGRAGHRRGPRLRREGPLHHRPDLRQRARRVQAGRRQAAPGAPQGDPGRRSAPRSARPTRSTWSSTAAPARPTRDRRGRLQRRHQDEHRHRHPVRVHPPVADHMFRNYDGVLKVDGEVGNKKPYDPRAWGKARRGRPWPPASSRLPSSSAPPARPSEHVRRLPQEPDGS